MSHSKLWLPMLLALATCPLTPLSAIADVPFRDWARDHQEWVSSHRDRYNFFMQHPDQADQHAEEWRGMNGNGNGLGHAYGHMKFMDWAKGHQDWVNAHHDRYSFFMQHPDQAEQMRPEWEGWSGHYNSAHPEWGGWTPPGTAGGGHMQWSEWSKRNPDWVSAHRDRYNYFMQHPDQAEKCRSEWEGWHGPGKGNNGLHLGEVAHKGMIPGHMMDPHNAGMHLGDAKKMMEHGAAHGNNGLHLGELAKMAPHGGTHTGAGGFHMSDLAKMAGSHAMAHSPGPGGHAAHFTDMMKAMPHMPAAHNPAPHEPSTRLTSLIHAAAAAHAPAAAAAAHAAGPRHR